MRRSFRLNSRLHFAQLIFQSITDFGRLALLLVTLLELFLHFLRSLLFHVREEEFGTAADGFRRDQCLVLAIDGFRGVNFFRIVFLALGTELLAALGERLRLARDFSLLRASGLLDLVDFS